MEQAFKVLFNHMIQPLLIHAENLMITMIKEGDTYIFTIRVDGTDLGRVIGKDGKNIDAIRTIAYAKATKDGIRIQIHIQSI